MATPSLAFMMSRPQYLLAMGFGTGLSRIWPGTVGTLAGFLPFFVLREFSAGVQFVAMAVLFAVGAWACQETGEALGEHDHNAIVWDEIWGMAAVLLASPPGWIWWVAGFVLFRVFDTVKPWPASYVDRTVRNGAGVMLDDAVAAVFAAVALVTISAILARVA